MQEQDSQDVQQEPEVIDAQHYQQAKQLFGGCYASLDKEALLADVHTFLGDERDAKGYLAGMLYLRDICHDGTLDEPRKAKERFNYYYNLRFSTLHHQVLSWQNSLQASSKPRPSTYAKQPSLALMRKEIFNKKRAQRKGALK